LVFCFEKTACWRFFYVCEMALRKKSPHGCSLPMTP
jgi:hypothetical protein